MYNILAGRVGNACNYVAVRMSVTGFFSSDEGSIDPRKVQLFSMTDVSDMDVDTPTIYDWITAYMLNMWYFIRTYDEITQFSKCWNYKHAIAVTSSQAICD